MTSTTSTEGHRFVSQIAKARDAGYVQFVLYGESLAHDWYENGLFLGTHGFRKTLVKQLLSPKGMGWVEKVIVLSNSDIILYEMQDSKLQQQTLVNAHQLSAAIRGVQDQGFKPSSLSGKSGAAADSEQAPADNVPQQDEENQSSLALYNCFIKITELLEETDIVPIAVIVENLAWISELFPNRNHKLEYLEEIEKWGSISAQSRHLSFISLPSLDEFSIYLSHIKEEAENCIFVTGPSVEELNQSMDSFYRMLKKKEPQLPDDCNWDSLATALKLKGYSLLQSIHFLDSFCRDYAKNQDAESSDNFTAAFKTRLGITIEEVDWERDVVLPDDTKESIDTIFEKFKAGKTSEIPKGILLHGPPGTGKTHIARGLANKGGCYFLPLKLADIKGKWVGHSGRNVQRIFQEARASAPTLIFIDEIDTIFGRRGGMNQDSFANDIVNQFLAETDGVDTAGQSVFIIGATNRIELVDSAVKSRMEPVCVGLPHSENRRELLEKHLAQNFEAGELDKLVDKSGGLSGRDLKSLANTIKNLQSTRQVSDAEAADDALEKMRIIVADDLTGDSFTIKLAKRTTDNPPNTLAGVIGYDKLCKQLSQAVGMITHDSIENSKLRAADIEPSNGILLYGPPGNGKTFIAQSLAQHHQMDYVLVSGQTLNAGVVDGTIRQLDTIIDNTIRMSVMGPVLLFFDEFDSLAADQGLTLKFRGALLNGINRLRQYPNILLMAATNYYQSLNGAVVRPGRFDSHLRMDNPESEDIVNLIQSFCSQDSFNLQATDTELAELADELVGEEVSIAEIKVLCKGAQQQAVLANDSSPYPIDYRQLCHARQQIRRAVS